MLTIKDIIKAYETTQQAKLEQQIKEELEKVKKERDRYYNALMSIQYETPALGGDEEDMEHALYNINWLCDWALRPDKMKDISKTTTIYTIL